MRALIFAMCLVTVSGCDEAARYMKSGNVSWALKKELRDKHSKSIDLAKLTNFTWEELFLFGPYEATKDVCSRLALPAAKCASVITSESRDDGEMLMVFRDKGDVVHTEMHLRFHGDFLPVAAQPIRRDSAIFTVSTGERLASGDDWLLLRPLPIP